MVSVSLTFQKRPPRWTGSTSGKAHRLTALPGSARGPHTCRQDSSAPLCRELVLTTLTKGFRSEEDKGSGKQIMSHDARLCLKLTPWRAKSDPAAAACGALSWEISPPRPELGLPRHASRPPQ